MEKETRVDLREFPELVPIYKTAFPDYNGRKFSVIVTEKSPRVLSYWEEGTRDYWCLIRLIDMKKIHIPQNGSMCEPEILLPNGLEPGFAVVNHSIFCGKDMGLTLYINPADTSRRMLNPPVDLIWEERVVLYASGHLKSSHGGIPNLRLVESRKKTGITIPAYDMAKHSLIQKGFLDKRGAITIKGRNIMDEDWPKKV